MEETNQGGSKSDRNYWIYAYSLLGIILLLTSYSSYQNYQTNKAVSSLISGKAADRPLQPQPQGNLQALAINEDDVAKGSKNAPVTIIEYSDPSCPFCAAAAGKNAEVINYLRKKDQNWEAPIPGIMRDYVNTGKARIAVRYFEGHGTGAEAMKILLCANEQGKFWELQELIFDSQDKIEDKAFLKDLAKKAGVDASKLNSCIEGNKYSEKLEKDIESGRAAGVDGTPAFFVNGIKLSVAQSFQAFRQVIDSELSN